MISRFIKLILLVLITVNLGLQAKGYSDLVGSTPVELQDLTQRLRAKDFNSLPKLPIPDWEQAPMDAKVVILGSGPAGLSAGVYTAKAGYQPIIIEGPKPGGSLTETSYVENWPGEERILGCEIINKLKAQNQGLGVKFIKDSVIDVDLSCWPYQLTTAQGLKLQTQSLIIATGSTAKLLGLPEEQLYWGAGVSTCVMHDALRFKDKKVVVVGGGNSALEQAVQLAPYAKEVTLLVRKNSLRASPCIQAKVQALKNVQIQYHTQVLQIIGNGEQVTGLKLCVNGKEQIKLVDGIFLAIGHDPASGLFKEQLATSEEGHLQLLPGTQQTSCPGVFAAGEVCDAVYRRAGVAAGEGMRAALDSIKFLQEVGA